MQEQENCKGLVPKARKLGARNSEARRFANFLFCFAALPINRNKIWDIGPDPRFMQADSD